MRLIIEINYYKKLKTRLTHFNFQKKVSVVAVVVFVFFLKQQVVKVLVIATWCRLDSTQ